MDFSQIIPSNMFNLFQSKHRDLYIESLIRIYKRYETGSILGMSKDEAKDIVIDLFEEKNISLNEFKEEEPDEDVPDYNELANKLLRRLEKTGWIMLDVTNDYLEILNFTDVSTTLTLAFIEIKNDANYSLFADNFSLDNTEQAFKGYIFTIYSLLNSKTYDYGLLLNQVYRNTINFVREIRKVDHKLKEFIQMIDTKENLKELIVLLSEYKDEVMDKAYFKLKTFDNINKYKLDIIKRLELMQEDSDIMNIIANDYLFISGNDVNLAKFTASKQINDCIDIYNSLESIMDEIDKKNRDYISQTLSKIKYLINDSTDITSELNSIISYYARMVKKDRQEKAYNDIKKLFDLFPYRSMQVSSLSSPRGTYKKNEVNTLSKDRIDLTKFKDTFFEMFKNSYNEDDIKKLVESIINVEEEKNLDDFISFDATKEDVIKLLYIIIFCASSDGYQIIESNDYKETKNYYIKNFKIKRRY